MTAFELNELYCDVTSWMKNLSEIRKELPASEEKTQLMALFEKIEIRRKKIKRAFSELIPREIQQATSEAELNFILKILSVQEDFRAGNEAKILHLLVQIFLNRKDNYPVELLNSYELSRYLYQNVAECSADSDIVLLTEWLIRNIKECLSDRMWFQGLRKKLVERHRFFGFQNCKPLNRRTHDLVRLYDLLLSSDGYLTDWKTGNSIPAEELDAQREEICQAVGKLGFLSEKGFQLFLSVVKTDCEL